MPREEEEEEVHEPPADEEEHEEEEEEAPTPAAENPAGEALAAPAPVLPQAPAPGSRPAVARRGQNLRPLRAMGGRPLWGAAAWAGTQ